jgi:hypothetical protein
LGCKYKVNNPVETNLFEKRMMMYFYPLKVFYATVSQQAISGF